MDRQKVALVTGANRGIGQEIARQLDAEGFRVIVTARDLEKAKAASKGLKNDPLPVALDVSNDDSVKEAERVVSNQLDYLDVLINNAGIIGNHDMLDFDLDQIDQVINVNFRGPILVTKFFMPMLKRSQEARVINISSGMGELDSLKNGGYAGYRLSKTALNAFTILLDAELDNSRIKVFSVCPGWVKTDMGGRGAQLEVSEGAETAVWLSSAEDVKSGKFYRNRKVIDWL